jgi:hypothetical protein
MTASWEICSIHDSCGTTQIRPQCSYESRKVHCTIENVAHYHSKLLLAQSLIVRRYDIAGLDQNGGDDISVPLYAPSAILRTQRMMSGVGDPYFCVLWSHDEILPSQNSRLTLTSLSVGFDCSDRPASQLQETTALRCALCCKECGVVAKPET